MKIIEKLDAELLDKKMLDGQKTERIFDAES